VAQAGPTRRLDWPDCRNTRDLGGLPCATGTTRHGVVIRSDNISNLNEAGVKAMWEYGVNTVIDLRTQTEATHFPSPFAAPDYGPQYVNLPVIDDAFMTRVNDTAGIPERYRLMVDHRQEAFGQIFNTLARIEGPAVVHCYAGKDRTGLVAAMLLSLAGVDDDAIAADYAETDIHLADRYKEWLASASPERLASMRDELRCQPEWMLGLLGHIDQRWGGVEPYLAAGGMEPGDLDRLKTKLAG
jgi:protein tyrosine/serine phosphatase